ncbi:MAG: MBL fold metallo-hydrolase [Acidobacteria bacterium]|nr:MBL fold metallo-hydrolase [Acidobacteriota bacterium]
MRNIGPVMILALFIVPACLWAQGDVKTIPVEGPVYMLEGGGDGNIGVLTTPSGPVVIDAMMANSSEQIKNALRATGGDNILYLINTHWHNDHTDGNKALGLGTIIVAHENVRPLLEKTSETMGGQAPPMPGNALPQVNYSDRLTLYAGDAVIRLVHYPNSHTNGDTVVYIDKYKVVHMGDMFFNGLFPFLDLDNGGDIENWVRNLDAVLAGLSSDVKIIPGHGPLSSPADLKAFRDMLADAAATVKERMKAGKNLDEIKAEGLPERFAPWTKGFFSAPQWLELVYRSVTKK